MNNAVAKVVTETDYCNPSVHARWGLMIENAPYKAINNACINIMSEALYLYINWYGANQFNGIRKKPQIGIPNEVNTPDSVQ